MNAPMNPNKALWEKGDFTRIAASMRESAEELVKELRSKSGVIDVRYAGVALRYELGLRCDRSRKVVGTRDIEGEADYVVDKDGMCWTSVTTPVLVHSCSR